MTDKPTPEDALENMQAALGGTYDAQKEAFDDLATAYLAMAKKNERLRKLIEAADRLADASTYFSTAFSGPNATKLLKALAAYRATEEQT